MSRETVNGTHKRRSRAEASRLVQEYLRSGLNLKAFCRQHNLDHSTLTHPDVSGQRINPPNSNAQTLCWVRIELARNFDAGTLRQLLHVLESR